ncbi:hypothetical protein FEF65_11355 [Mariprofundus erugo]|uniref:Uncharacterized protein n=1 Tax=Mariprofundus erugo TaxID=2528639 RepID=A0A5R9GIT4_9PROT|nr:hypothetical protein [Mariprofundus erugo]TLS66180.1 hypothetical protein FEF65_11355 [Mariprofundus erugo]
MRLGDIAEIHANIDTLEDGDIVMMAVGEGVGAVVQYSASFAAEMNSKKLVIRTLDGSVFERLQGKQTAIRAMAKGAALLRITVTDLKELDI